MAGSPTVPRPWCPHPGPGGLSGVGRLGVRAGRADLAGAHVRGELGADAAGISVIDLLENRQGLRPGPAGSAGVARAEVHIAEAGQGSGLVVAVTESAVQAESTLVADRGLL